MRLARHALRGLARSRSLRGTRNLHGGAHGGAVVNLMVDDPAEAAALLARTAGTPPVDLTERQACDVELLLCGAFSPLTGFMNEDAYDHVVEHMRLPERDGHALMGMPVTLDVADDAAHAVGDDVLLRYRGKPVAVLAVEDRFAPDKGREALRCYGTASEEHPTVHELNRAIGPHYLGGAVRGLAMPERPFEHKTPAEVRREVWGDALVPASADDKMIAFQCRNPIHRSHFELIRRAAEDFDANVLVHPTCGPTQPGDIEALMRIRTYGALREELGDPGNIKWANLPYSMKMAGPRECVHHMIMRKNYGCTHFIVGRDLAGTKSTATGEDFYGPYDAQELAREHAAELDMEVVTYENIVYTGEEHGYMQESEANEQGHDVVKLSGTEFRRLLRSGEEIPEWFAFKSVVDVLRAEESA